MPGARVIIRASLGGESVIDLPMQKRVDTKILPMQKRVDTKIYEVWAILGYGLIVDPFRCKKII